MAKGDSGEMNTQLQQQAPTNQSMQQNYNTGVGMNVPNYSSIMNNYNQFLSGSQASPAGKSTNYFNPSQSQFGDLTQPNNWMGVVSNPQQLDAFVKQGLGSQGNNQQLVDYYKSKIQGQPGANPTEQAGSAQYWMDKLMNDPNVTGQPSGGQGGGSAIQGWQNFAQTGGFSPQDIQDIRARAIAPTRAIYQNAQNDLATQKALTGGYMPNFAAAQANLARQSNYGISDANVNANAAIAQMVQQGKLYGLSGLTNAQLGAMAGQTSLYGATPGLANTFGNQVNQSNQIANQGKFNQSQIPGNFQQAAGNTATGLNLASAGANFLKGITGNNSNTGPSNPQMGGPSGPMTSGGDITPMINFLRGQGYNNANNGQGLGNTQPGFQTSGYVPSEQTTPFFSPKYGGGGYGQDPFAGVDPNTGLKTGESQSGTGDPYNVPFQNQSYNENPLLGVDPAALQAFNVLSGYYGTQQPQWPSYGDSPSLTPENYFEQGGGGSAMPNSPNALPEEFYA